MQKVRIKLSAHGGTIAEGLLDIAPGTDMPDLESRLGRLRSYSGNAAINGTGIFIATEEVPDQVATPAKRKRAPAGTKADGTPRKPNTAKSPDDKRLQNEPPSREDAKKGGKKAGAIQQRRAAKDKASGQKNLL